MEKRSILKIKKNFLAGVSLLIFLLLAVKVVQAIELGGFDVDMGTGSFEDDSSWDQEETTGGTTSSDNDNYDSNNNWSNTEDSWNTGDDSSGAGAGSYTTGNTNTAQPETDWNDFSQQTRMKMELQTTTPCLKITAQKPPGPQTIRTVMIPFTILKIQNNRSQTYLQHQFLPPHQQ